MHKTIQRTLNPIQTLAFNRIAECNDSIKGCRIPKHEDAKKNEQYWRIEFLVQALAFILAQLLYERDYARNKQAKGHSKQKDDDQLLRCVHGQLYLLIIIIIVDCETQNT
jgi:hypothetical protein